MTGDEETTMDTARDVMARHRELIDADFALNPDAGSADLDEATGRPIIYGVETADHVFAALTQLVRASGLATIIATHNMELAARMDRRVTIKEGKVVELD